MIFLKCSKNIILIPNEDIIKAAVDQYHLGK